MHEYWLRKSSKRESIFYKLTKYKHRVSLACATLIYVFFVCFFILMGLRDVSALLTDVYAFIPIWLMFGSAFVLLSFFSIAYFILGEKPLVIIMLILIGVFIAGFIKSFLVILNTSILAVRISWFIIMIPAYLAITGFWFIALYFFIYDVRKQLKKKNNDTKKKIKNITRSFGIFCIPNCVLASALLMAANGDYPDKVHVAIDFAPLYPVEIILVIIIIRWLVKERKSTYRQWTTLVMLVTMIMFFIALMANQVVVSLQEYAKRYVWLSSLLPLTLAYFFVIILCVENLKNGLRLNF
jgi:hypothetical protein